MLPSAVLRVLAPLRVAVIIAFNSVFNVKPSSVTNVKSELLDFPATPAI